MTSVCHFLAHRRNLKKINSSAFSVPRSCHLCSLHVFKDGLEPASQDAVTCVPTVAALEDFSYASSVLSLSYMLYILLMSEYLLCF